MLALIADDEPGLLRLMTHICVRAGLRTAVVADGPALLDAARRLQPELVISDLNMPGGRDGLQTCALIRELLPATAFIIMTGNILKLNDIQDRGFAHVLLKPFTTEEAAAIIGAATRRPFAIMRPQKTTFPCAQTHPRQKTSPQTDPG